MPIDPALLKSLADGGGLVLFLTVIVIAALAIHRGIVVPGWIFRRQENELAEAKRELSTAHKTIDRLTVQLTRERRHRNTDHAPD